MDEADDATETARDFLHVSDLGDQIVRCSYDGGAFVGECYIVDRLVGSFVDRAVTGGKCAYGVLGCCD